MEAWKLLSGYRTSCGTCQLVSTRPSLPRHRELAGSCDIDMSAKRRQRPVELSRPLSSISSGSLPVRSVRWRSCWRQSPRSAIEHHRRDLRRANCSASLTLQHPHIGSTARAQGREAKTRLRPMAPDRWQRQRRRQVRPADSPASPAAPDRRLAPPPAPPTQQRQRQSMSAAVEQVRATAGS